MRSHPYLTVAQMAEELGIGAGTIYDYCRELNVTPVSAAQQRRDFILSHKHWGRERLARVLGVDDGSIRRLCSELEIEVPLQDTPKTIRTLSDQLKEWWL